MQKDVAFYQNCTAWSNGFRPSPCPVKQPRRLIKSYFYETIGRSLNLQKRIFKYQNRKVNQMNFRRFPLLCTALLLFCALALNSALAQDDDEDQKHQKPVLTIYQSPEASQWFAYDHEYGLGEELYFSRDGKNFQKLANEGYAGSDNDHHLDYYNPVTDESGELDFVKTEQYELIVYEGVKFEKTSIDPATIKLLPLPEVRIINAFVRTAAGQYLLMTSNLYDESGFDHNSVRLFLGTPGNMRPLTVTKVETYCGGSSYQVFTAQGIFDTTNKVVTWRGSPVWAADVDDFKIVHTSTKVELSRKSAGQKSARRTGQQGFAAGGC